MTVSADLRWRALRALHENHGAPDGLLAEASGLQEATIAAKALAHGWVRMTRPPVNLLIDQLLERLVRDAHAIAEGGADNYPKAHIDGLGSLLRTAEKLRELTITNDVPEQQSRERDDKIAAILGRIDTQIHRLAHAYADDIGKSRKRSEKPRSEAGQNAGIGRTGTPGRRSGKTAAKILGQTENQR